MRVDPETAAKSVKALRLRGAAGRAVSKFGDIGALTGALADPANDNARWAKVARNAVETAVLNLGRSPGEGGADGVVERQGNHRYEAFFTHPALAGLSPATRGMSVETLHLSERASNALAKSRCTAWATWLTRSLADWVMFLQSV